MNVLLGLMEIALMLFILSSAIGIVLTGFFMVGVLVKYAIPWDRLPWRR